MPSQQADDFSMLMKSSGAIDEIFINVNPGETDLQKYIGDGGHWNIKIKFFEQRGDRRASPM